MNGTMQMVKETLCKLNFKVRFDSSLMLNDNCLMICDLEMYEHEAIFLFFCLFLKFKCFNVMYRYFIFSQLVCLNTLMLYLLLGVMPNCFSQECPANQNELRTTDLNHLFI